MSVVAVPMKVRAAAVGEVSGARPLPALTVRHCATSRLVRWVFPSPERRVSNVQPASMAARADGELPHDVAGQEARHALTESVPGHAVAVCRP